jgi:nitroreductase
MSQITQLIQRRRSIYPPMYDTTRPIERATIEQVLDNARWAPTHKRTQPWRFRVFHSAESRKALGQYLADYYLNNTEKEQISEQKHQKMLENPQRAGAVVAIIMQRDAAESLPEFEEIAAVAMAVQNMWLTCTELGLGCYWSTPSAILKADEFLQLQPGQRCLGIFYMGWHHAPDMQGQRKELAEVTTFI